MHIRPTLTSHRLLFIRLKVSAITNYLKMYNLLEDQKPHQKQGQLPYIILLLKVMSSIFHIVAMSSLFPKRLLKLPQIIVSPIHIICANTTIKHQIFFLSPSLNPLEAYKQ